MLASVAILNEKSGLGSASICFEKTAWTNLHEAALPGGQIQAFLSEALRENS